jgi:starch phosphorylase
VDQRTRAPSAPLEEHDDRTGLSKEALKRAFVDNLFYMQGKFPALATRTDYYLALAYVVRDRLLQRWISTAAAYTREGARTVAYLSAEFLMGPHLGNNLINLGIHARVKQAITELGLDFDELLNEEEEPGLGNGGLGRLAACFLDSLATLEMPVARLRHPLRVRHLLPGDPGRLAGREDRQVAALRQPVGSRAPRMGGRGEAGRAHRTIPR